MKLTKRQLKQIIKEELELTINEQEKAKYVNPGTRDRHIRKAYVLKYEPLGYTEEQLRFLGYDPDGNAIVRPYPGQMPGSPPGSPEKYAAMKRAGQAHMAGLKQKAKIPVGKDGKPLLSLRQLKALFAARAAKKTQYDKQGNPLDFKKEYARYRSADPYNAKLRDARDKQEQQAAARRGPAARGGQKQKPPPDPSLQP